ncbi:MAG: deoxyribose-phosphate aldolase [Clostridia bacterium]|nr:deoxyribose-phosphate aldolase [Clostridia bacterium]
MDKNSILKLVDHTLLAQTATLDDILTIVDDGIKYGTASVCIPSCYVAAAVKHANGKLPICTVVGFPNGNYTTEAKVAETAKALADGAAEIDMVINIGMLKAKNYDYVLEEIKTLKKLCGERVLKVIIETCLLTDEEKIKMCEIVSASGADFIKTSTGFSTGGATREDIALFKANVREGLGIKAAGGIRSFADAEDFINLGATRLGTSSLVKIIKNEELGSY